MSLRKTPEFVRQQFQAEVEGREPPPPSAKATYVPRNVPLSKGNSVMPHPWSALLLYSLFDAPLLHDAYTRKVHSVTAPRTAPVSLARIMASQCTEHHAWGSRDIPSWRFHAQYVQYSTICGTICALSQESCDPLCLVAFRVQRHSRFI